MKRSQGVTWDQLRVGALVLVACAILVIAIFKLGQAANLFSKRYRLVTFLSNTAGLQRGGSVTIAGQLAGIVDKIEFLPPSGDTGRNLKLTLEIDSKLRDLVREDSRAKLKSMGILGDKVLEITPGTPRFAVLQPNDTIPSVSTLDFDVVLQQASAAVGDMVKLTHDLRDITGSLARGEGTVGQLMTNRTLYDQLNTSLERFNAVLARVDNSHGTFGRMLDDPTLYDHLTSVAAGMDSLVREMHSGNGTIARLLTNDTLYTRMVTATTSADSLLKLLTSGNGTASKMLTDQQLYDRLNQTLTTLNAVLEEVRKDPSKYTKGMVKIF